MCSAFAETTYAQGILPIDTYKRDLGSICEALTFRLGNTA